ncbi:MAG: hypothetical protein ABI977_18550 [Acidobacteriota bacterium]
MNQTENLVKPPAIGLIVIGAINALSGLFWLVSKVLRAAGIMAPPPSGPAGDEGAPYRLGGMVAEVVFFLSLIAAPFIIKGAVDMLKGRKFSSAKMAAILAMIPMTSCCFLLGAPFGIWALIVLSKPEVKTFFETGRSDFSPPPPPQYP